MTKELTPTETGERLGNLWNDPKFMRFLLETDRIKVNTPLASIKFFCEFWKVSGYRDGINLLKEFEAWSATEQLKREA